MIELTFLGTSCALPTKTRNHNAIHLKYFGNSILFDCGEGTQRQLNIAGISPYKIQNIFISHMHADHILGLGGLIQSLGLLNRKEALNIYGPKGLKRYVDFNNSLEYVGFKSEYEINVHEIRKDGPVFEGGGYSVSAFALKHSVPCYGYVFEEVKDANLDVKKLRKFGLENNVLCRDLKAGRSVEWNGKTVSPKDVQEKGVKRVRIGVVMDTGYFKGLSDNVRDCDLLVTEASYGEDERDKAHAHGHMTAKEAATVAKEANAKRLVITHISPRYDNVAELKAEARRIFKGTDVAEDFMRISI